MPPRKVKVTKVQGLEQINDELFKPILEAAAGVQITIGIHDKEAEERHPGAEMTVGDLAAIHEFGRGTAPPRPGLRQFYDQHVGQMANDLQAAMLQVMSGTMSRKKAFEAFGYKWTDNARKFYFDGKVRPALKASTIRAKGHGLPLIDTGRLANSITYKLRLQNVKSIQDPAVREVVRRGG